MAVSIPPQLKCRKGVNDMIYLDNAATTRVREEVLEAMLPMLKEEFGNPSGVYSVGRRAHRELDRARERVAAAINAAYPREVYFTGCGTESDNWAIKGVAFANRDKGNHIITTKVEHHAVLDTCEYLEKQGFEVTYLDVDEYGMVTADMVAAAIRPETILISVMFANNEVGTINPIEEIGALAKEKGILFHTDAVQAVAHVPVDVQAMHIDLLSLTGHKFYSPKGTGALYIRNGVKCEKFVHGGAQERKRRAGTENMAGIVAMGKAVELAVAEMEEETARVTALRDLMIREITTRIPHVKLNGHPEKRLPGNVNVSIEYIEAESLLMGLDLQGICCSSGSACTSGSMDASHVLLAMGLSPETAKGALRFTIGRYNTREDIEDTVAELELLTERLRRISPLCPKEVCEGCRCATCDKK